MTTFLAFMKASRNTNVMNAPVYLPELTTLEPMFEQFIWELKTLSVNLVVRSLSEVNTWKGIKLAVTDLKHMYLFYFRMS